MDNQTLYQNMLGGCITSYTMLIFRTQDEHERQKIHDAYKKACDEDYKKQRKINRRKLEADKEQFRVMSDDDLRLAYRGSLVCKTVLTRSGRTKAMVDGASTSLVRSVANERGLKL